MTNGLERLKRSGACVALLSAVSFAALAQEAPDDTSLEVTIRLLPQNAVGPEEITRRIELPPAATAARPEQAVPPEDPTEGAEPAAESGRGQGQSPAPEARERGQAPSTAPAERGQVPNPAPAARERAQGLDTATEARQRGQETADRTRENRENAGRPDERGRPDDPGPPDQPRGPPETPPGRP